MGYGGAVDAGAVSTIRPPAASTAPAAAPLRGRGRRGGRWVGKSATAATAHRGPRPPSVRPAYHPASTELAPEVRKGRVRELLLGYRHGAAVPLWPGADGL